MSEQPPKKLRRKSLPLSPISEVEEFVEEFRSALNRGEFDPYLYELVEAVDERTSSVMNYAAEEPDAFVSAFLRRVKHLRVGPPVLEPDACYTLLGASHEGVVVRYIEPYEDKIRVEVVRSYTVRAKKKQSLVEGNTYRIPASAIDRKTDDPEGK